MSTIGLSFSSMEQGEANALRKRLNRIFGVLGYATDTSVVASRERRNPWAGGLPKGLVGLDGGELAVVRVNPSPTEVQAVIAHLRKSMAALAKDFNQDADHIIAALSDYADALELAAARRTT